MHLWLINVHFFSLIWYVHIKHACSIATFPKDSIWVMTQILIYIHYHSSLHDETNQGHRFLRAKHVRLALKNFSFKIDCDLIQNQNVLSSSAIFNLMWINLINEEDVDNIISKVLCRSYKVYWFSCYWFKASILIRSTYQSKYYVACSWRVWGSWNSFWILYDVVYIDSFWYIQTRS